MIFLQHEGKRYLADMDSLDRFEYSLHGSDAIAAIQTFSGELINVQIPFRGLSRQELFKRWLRYQKKLCLDNKKSVINIDEFLDCTQIRIGSSGSSVDIFWPPVKIDITERGLIRTVYIETYDDSFVDIYSSYKKEDCEYFIEWLENQMGPNTEGVNVEKFNPSQGSEQ